MRDMEVSRQQAGWVIVESAGRKHPRTHSPTIDKQFSLVADRVQDRIDPWLTENSPGRPTTDIASLQITPILQNRGADNATGADSN